MPSQYPVFDTNPVLKTGRLDVRSLLKVFSQDVPGEISAIKLHILNGNQNILRKLLRRPGQPALSYYDGLLYFAVLNGCYKTGRLLVRNGANPLAGNRIILRIAREDKRIGFVKFCRKHLEKQVAPA